MPTGTWEDPVRVDCGDLTIGEEIASGKKVIVLNFFFYNGEFESVLIRKAEVKTMGDDGFPEYIGEPTVTISMERSYSRANSDHKHGKKL